MEVDVFNIIASILLMLIIISVSVAVIFFIGSGAKKEIPNQVQQTVERFVNVFFAKSPYNFCEAISGKEISLSDFYTLLQAVYGGQCGSTHANVTLSFSLSKEDILKTARTLAIAKGGELIYYDMASPLGVGGIIIQGQAGYYPLKKWDTIEIWQEGEPQPDVLIKMTIKGCDPYDDVCDALCTYKNICDPVCDDGQKHDITCNLACIDTNGNKTVDEEDVNKRIEDNKCNPDCYTNITNPFKAYDPGCVYKYHVKQAEMYDNICDPNSNGVKDGLCDPDCVKTKNICDPDCDGVASSGNPNGINDRKCSVCDGTCSGWCSPACKYPFDDLDCERNTDPTFWCDGDQICDSNRGENCQNSKDCKKICDDKNFICCPDDKKADDFGCTDRKNLKEGEQCGCDKQCINKMKCDGTYHCCPDEMEWNGTDCEIKYTFTILFIQVNGNVQGLESGAQAGKDLWVKLSPLKKCPGKVRAIAVTDKVCSVNECDPFNALYQCVKSWGYEGKYTRLVGIVPRSYVCAPGIRGLTGGYGYPMLSIAGNIEATSSHEMGHTFGTCDEGYGGSPCSRCSSGYCQARNAGIDCDANGPCCPNHPEHNSIYCSWNRCGTDCTYATNFAPSSYVHLEKELDKYCK